MIRAWLQTLTGRALTIAAPSPSMIDLSIDLPEMLGRVPRFNGATTGGHFSVAQHSCNVSDAILEETGDIEAATVGLLHDAHEYVIGDFTQPAAEAFAEIERELFGLEGTHFRAVLDEAKRRLDRAIFAACGVPWPPAEHKLRIVKTFDLRMLATEKRQLLAPPTRRWSPRVENAEPIRMRGRIYLWSAIRAADEFRSRLARLCPAVAARFNQEG
jgi:hypothetical protein